MATVRYTVLDGEIVAEKRDSVRRSYVPDAIGSTVALLNNTQTQTDTISYWPYGEVKTRTGTTATPFGYGGTWGYYTDVTVRAYVQARQLSTTEGRWLSKDLIGFESGDWNLYRYTGNAPTTVIDKSGLRSESRFPWNPFPSIIDIRDCTDKQLWRCQRKCKNRGGQLVADCWNLVIGNWEEGGSPFCTCFPPGDPRRRRVPEPVPVRVPVFQPRAQFTDSPAWVKVCVGGFIVIRFIGRFLYPPTNAVPLPIPGG